MLNIFFINLFFEKKKKQKKNKKNVILQEKRKKPFGNKSTTNFQLFFVSLLEIRR